MPTATLSAAGTQTRRALCWSTRTACLCVPVPIQTDLLACSGPPINNQGALCMTKLERRAGSLGMIRPGPTSRHCVMRARHSRAPCLQFVLSCLK